MSTDFWVLIFVLAAAAFSIRILGLVAGDTIKASKHAWILEEIPGLIIISLVAASLTGQGLTTWIAAGAALAIAWLSNHVIWTMCGGVAVFALLNFMGSQGW
ncbi:AzlD domain-containing protein [Sneathiella glossodoripedis]|uniref:AzlD domain-containing protein n=1 Tax=Sneathiella glossodoripedis TaxID=418853 RepID=UPI00046F4357|nr:AzlD domain-containing protein [Sneathiella glossodoripedis]